MKWQDPKPVTAGTLFGMNIVVDSSLSPGQVLLIDSSGIEHVVDNTSGDLAVTAWRLL